MYRSRDLSLGDLSLGAWRTTGTSLSAVQGAPQPTSVEVNASTPSGSRWGSSRAFQKGCHAGYSTFCQCHGRPGPDAEPIPGGDTEPVPTSRDNNKVRFINYEAVNEISNLDLVNREKRRRKKTNSSCDSM